LRRAEQGARAGMSRDPQMAAEGLRAGDGHLPRVKALSHNTITTLAPTLTLTS